MKSTSDRVPLADVRDLLHVGGLLPFRILDAQERLLLNQGQAILDEAQFEALVDRGAWAERNLVDAERKARAAEAAPPVVVQLSLFDRWERLLWQFDKLARALVRQELPATALSPFLDSLRALVDRDPDIALFLCTRQEDHRFALYPLAALDPLRGAGHDDGTPAGLGRQPRGRHSGHAALSMNLGILELQATMAEQEDPPTRKQLDRIRAHPDAAVALLRAAGIVDEDWLAIVADHHEHTGGGGYPSGKNEVHQSAHVLRAIDVYMAKISPRAKRAGVVAATRGAPAVPAEPSRSPVDGRRQDPRRPSPRQPGQAAIRRDRRLHPSSAHRHASRGGDPQRQERQALRRDASPRHRGSGLRAWRRRRRPRRSSRGSCRSGFMGL